MEEGGVNGLCATARDAAPATAATPTLACLGPKVGSQLEAASGCCTPDRLAVRDGVASSLGPARGAAATSQWVGARTQAIELLLQVRTM